MNQKWKNQPEMDTGLIRLLGTYLYVPVMGKIRIRIYGYLLQYCFCNIL